ncbi:MULTISPECIES: GAF domain-containing sensor histidine kinase [unclassified Sedimentibacter]|uniref:GAF domain-containing sensor histidine kinase n=1 Tax=unclassified Sedimentibacter TaxID=2649220 RepID=UPI0027E19444|nr:ATP-binding protein [Sedimentibacter sp. MB35-C1]WMJ77516.1 ATP-binding protein [Sedimentibacter sp. MB35-C1]
MAKNTKGTDLYLLSETFDQISKVKDFQAASDIIFNFIKKFIVFDMAVIYRINDNENTLEIASCLGSDAEKLKRRMPFKIGEGAVGLVAKNKKSILINDALKNNEVKVRQYYNEDPIIRSFLAVPLVVGDKSVGILSVSSSKTNQYVDYEVQLINIIASQAALLLELNSNIKETKNFSNKILDNVNSGIMVIDNSSNIIIFNKSAEVITGFSVGEILGINIEVLQLELENKEKALSLNNQRTFFEEPGYLVRKDGSTLRIRFSTSFMYNYDNTIKSCICIFRDNTEIEKLQRQIVMADKLAALGRLTAGLVHEIRNPLLPIRNASEYLLSKYGNEGTELSNLLNIIKEESNRLNRVTDQLVSMSKDSYYSIGNCYLDEVIDEVLTLLKYTINKNEIKLNIEYNSDEIILPYNKDNLKQVFINLLLNSIDALKSIKENKERIIEIRINKKTYDAYIDIKDNGTGISKNDINLIFDPFFTTKECGTGIGLSIVFNIIKKLGGDIFIESDISRGTTVSLMLPIVKERK